MEVVDNDVSHLRVVAVLGLIIKVKEVSTGAPPRVVKSYPHDRRDGVAVAERLHRRLAYVDGVQHGLVPVRVLVAHRAEYLVEMVDVGVADEGAQHAVALVLLEAVLYVVGVEVEVGLGGGDAQDQRYLDERVAQPLHVQARIGVAAVDWHARPDARHESAGKIALTLLYARALREI